MLVLLLSACGTLPFGASAPVVRISAPQDGVAYLPGISIAIIGTAGGVGVRSVRVMIDGTPMAVQAVNEMFTPVALSWMPDRSGTHVVHLEALDVDGTLLARSDMVMVQVLASAPPPPTPIATPTSPPTLAATQTPVIAATETVSPTSVATSTVFAATAIASPTMTATVFAATTIASPTMTATVFAAAATTAFPLSPTLTVIVPLANLRSGPGADYPLAGQAAEGAVLPIVGRDAGGAWWQVQQVTRTLWIASAIVETEATERDVPLIAIATRESVATVTPTLQATETPTATAVLTVPEVTPTNAAAAGMEPCNEKNPHWAVKESKDPDYTFCAAVPFEFVEQTNDGRMLLRWHMYGIEQLELRIDPNGSNCGMGQTGLREIVSFKMDAYELNRRNFPRGGYKIGLWATLPGGRVQDYGELNFCGEG